MTSKEYFWIEMTDQLYELWSRIPQDEGLFSGNKNMSNNSWNFWLKDDSIYYGK